MASCPKADVEKLKDLLQEENLHLITEVIFTFSSNLIEISEITCAHDLIVYRPYFVCCSLSKGKEKRKKKT